MTYFEKSFTTLELPSVLSLLSQHCVSFDASRQATELKPSTDISEVRRRLAETSAAVTLSNYKGAPTFFGLINVSESLRRAELGGALGTKELLDIASLLQCARLTARYIDDDRIPQTEINCLFRGLSFNRYLEDKIKSIIISENEISDNASPELFTIRRKIQTESANARAALQKIISSPGYSKYLQEPIVTMRSGRFVVPVKIEYKNNVPGLVHDVSSSGMTVFVEPNASVKANNELKELAAKERIEIDRILSELSSECASFGEDIVADYNLLVRLDLLFAKAALSSDMNAVEATLEASEGIVLNKARHPLIDKTSVVPVNILLGSNYDTLVITGPNTGGKTVCLKTIGLLALMNQCGLHIPAGDRSNLPVFSNILADIGDEQSIEQSLSTFSSHMTNIKSIIDESGDNSLVLFDELGAGTDPTEGAALATSIIENIRKKGALIAATTHYSELKTYALNTEGVRNASCEFDVETLKPTYRLVLGIPGKSNAFAISLKLGLPKEIIDDASMRIGEKDADFEKTVAKLDEIRNEVENEKLETEKLLRKAETEAKKASMLRAELEVRLEKADIKARREAQRIIDDARSAAEEVFSELDRMKETFDCEREAERINEDRNILRKKLKDAVKVAEKESEIEDPEPDKPVRTGDIVLIKAMNMKAEVMSVSDDGALSLRAGIINMTASRNDVIITGHIDEKVSKTKYSGRNTALRTETVSSEIDLRGMDSIEAVYVAEQYIDNAVMSKLNSVYLIHGKGTGVLRAAIHQMLKKNKSVKSYRLGTFGEGEDGVTVVELK